MPATSRQRSLPLLLGHRSGGVGRDRPDGSGDQDELLWHVVRNAGRRRRSDPLARLPAALIAADVDFGPFLLALTPHSVLAAPCHRLSSGILAANAAFAAPPPDAERILSRLQTTYVVTCGTQSLLG